MKCKTVLLMTMLIAAGSLLSAQGLKVEPGSCIKVETGTTLAISEGGNLILKSDATGDASLIDLGSVSYTGGGEAKVQRYLTQGQWHLISSPLTDAVSGMFLHDYLQKHDESTNGWTYIITVNTPLVVMQGYSLWTVDGAPTTELFTGTTNTGNQTFSFTKSGLGFNLVGNPYPSVLDWDAVSIPTELSGAIWLFDPTMGTNGDYRYYISGGGGSNTTTQYIPSGQGFFVRATDGSGTLIFENNDRTHGGQAFYKAGAENQMLVLKATGNNITTQTAIRFIADATPQADRLYDVQKIISNSTDVPNVYTKCESENMAINTLPSVAGHETVPLYFEVGMDGTYSFTATELESLGEDVPVFLEDISLNYVQDMRANPNYSFAYTTGAVRQFNIHFKDVTGVDELSANAPQFHCYMGNGQLHVNFTGNEPFAGKATIAVYNTAGQLVMQTQTAQAETTLALQGSAAMYIVQVLHSGHLFSTKVINQKNR